MRVLGLESSAMTASVAIMTDDVLTAEYSTNFKQTHSQTLLPMLDEICKCTRTDVKDIDVIAISSGPGSFTGLRIGSATAKGLGLALEKPIVEVPTLEALAYNVSECDTLICPMMDARRGNVYAGVYSFMDSRKPPLKVMDVTLVSVEELISKINELGQNVVFLGDAVHDNMEILSKTLNVTWKVAPAQSIMPRAASVCALGKIYASQGKCIDADEHSPNYLRPSQAEREREKKSNEK